MDIESIVASIAEHDRQAIWITNADPVGPGDLSILWCNRRFTETTGHRASGSITTTIPVIDGSGDEEAPQHLMTQLKGADSFTRHLRYRHGDGSTVASRMRFSPVLDVGGAAIAWIVFQRDQRPAPQHQPHSAPPDELQRDLDAAIHSAEQAEGRLWSILNTMPDGFVLYDADDRIIVANDAFRDFHAPVSDKIRPGISFEELLRHGMNADMWDYEGKDPERWVQEQLYRRRSAASANTLVRLKDGRWMQRNEQRLPNGEMVGLRVDVTELKAQHRAYRETARQLEAANAELGRKAMVDELTGAASRHGLEKALASLAAHPDPDQRIALLYIDLDRFKQINTTLGHDAGDHILKAVATLLRPLLAQDDLLARIGGDVFILVLDLGDTDRSAEAVARQVVHKLSRPIQYRGRPCRFTASVGVALAPDGPVDPARMLINAEIALHRAKENGRAQIETFCERMQSALITRKKLADEILHGIEQGEFFPHFQPQFDAETLEIVGVEALARWNHPTRGILAPAHFLDIAEDMNVIADLDQAILERSLAEMGRLRQMGLQPSKLSVNVSLTRLTDPSLLERIDTLGSSGGHPVLRTARDDLYRRAGQQL